MPRKYNHAVRSVISTVGPSISYVPLTKGLYALIDREDESLVGGRNWNAAGRYANSAGLGMHVAILKPSPGMIPDHINGNTMDNRRANLREATYSENARNRRVHKNNTSGYKCVFWNTQKGKWQARTRIDYQIRDFGFFDTAEEAYIAYLVGINSQITCVSTNSFVNRVT